MKSINGRYDASSAQTVNNFPDSIFGRPREVFKEVVIGLVDPMLTLPLFAAPFHQEVELLDE